MQITPFTEAVTTAGGVAGGLHLEVTPEPVNECVADGSELARVGDHYTTLCDPRLNLEQALAVVANWTL